MDKLYSLGLDIGIASVGWSILENDPTTETPIKILDLGVRTFNTNEIPKTGESTAKSRREKRGTRRRNRRRALRISTAKRLIENHLNINVENALTRLLNADVYQLRAKALDDKITNEELAKIVLNIFKRRGFKSNRKTLDEKNSGELLSAISKNDAFLKEKGYRTFGEAIYKDNRFKTIVAGHIVYNVRNHDDSYKNCIDRNLLIAELNLIFESQKQLGNTYITDEFKDKIISLFEKQRNFDEGPGFPSPYSGVFEIGNCTFIKGEKRASKATFTFEYFTALSKINSLRIDDEELTLDDKKTLYELLLTKKEIKFKDVRKILGVSPTLKFNLCRYVNNKKDENLTEEQLLEKSEKSTFVKISNSYEIRSSLGLDINEKNVAIIDEIATILTLYKSDEKIDEAINQSPLLNRLSEQDRLTIKSFNYKTVGSLSIKAMQNIIPYLLEGYRYDEACKNAGYNHSSFSYEKRKYLKGEDVEERLKDITSPVVKRSVNQTIRIINEIIKTYGSPQFVSIELARDLSLKLADRRKIENKQIENFNEREKVKDFLSKEFNLITPSAQDVLKYRLYMEQDGKCIYSGNEIDVNRLFEPNYVEIDHILPYSRSMNDSYNNKVLVLAEENQMKRNRTPYEYIGDNEKHWLEFIARVNTLKNQEKKKFLLKKNFGETQSKEFISRNINDTRYASRFMHELVKDVLLTTPSKKHKKVIRCVNGAVTNYLRKFWGVNKIREDGDIHHAIDATIVASVTDGMIKKVVSFNNMKERFIYNKNVGYINKTTGEIMSEEEKSVYEQEGINVYSKHLPTPYPKFLEELGIRSKIKYNMEKFTEDELYSLYKIGYENVDHITPVFISRAKTVKTTGAIHKETLMSDREYAETKRLVTTVKLDKLKLTAKAEEISLQGDEYPNFSIENYYRPQDDRLLYLKLKKHLKEIGAYKANEIVYKPKKDGSDGPLVKKVKVYEYSSNCVHTPNGSAANDKMHRVDVYKKDGKFYLCPIYMADVYAKTYPNKVIEIQKDWTEIDDTFEFLFALYQNDLIRVVSRKEIVLSKAKNNTNSAREDTLSSNEVIGYYIGTDISTASIKLTSHDSCYERKLGVKTLLNIEKLNVDILGKVYKAQKENRKDL